MKTQHDDEMQELPEILQKLRDTECSLLLERFFDSNTLLHVAANIGHDQIVEAILSKQQCQQELLTATNSTGDLPLHVAANAGHLSIVQHLVESHLCQELLMAKNSNGDLPLHVAANAGHLSIVQHLVKSHLCQELLMAKNSNGDLPLHVVANAGHLSIVKFLVESLRQTVSCQGSMFLQHKTARMFHPCQELLMAKNSNGDHPLHVAANAGHVSIVKYLVSFSRMYQYQEELKSDNAESGDDAESGDSSDNAESGDNAEPSAESSDNTESGDNAESGDNVEPSSESSDNAKSSDDSVQTRHYLLHKLLFEENNEGNTLLHLALIKKYEEVDVNLKSKYNEVAEFLIHTHPGGPELWNYKNKAGMSPEYMAEEAEDADLLKFIFESWVLVPNAAAYNDAKMVVDRRVSDIADTSKRVPGKRKPKDKVTSMDGELYEAVKLQNIALIQQKAQDLEHSAFSDKTPELNSILHLAAASSDDDQFVQAILGIQLCQKFVTEKNSNGDLPLHVAVSAGNMQIVELLVKWPNEHLKDHGNYAPLVEKNREENTALHLALIKKFQAGRNSAMKAKYNKVAKFLAEKCPEVSFYPNKERKSPLYLAAEGGDEELVRQMITTNCLPHGKSIVHAAIYYLMTITNLPYGKSIVHAAIYGSFTAMKLRCLNAHAASFLCPSTCLNTNTDTLDTVLKSLPDDILKEKDDEGMTPLFYAASIGYLDGVEILLKKPTKCGAYDQRDTDGYYPIHIASRKGHIQVIKKFLDKYPDMIELLNEEGQNILHVAAMYGKAKVVAHMLKRHNLKVEMLINNEDENGNTPLHLAAMKGHPMVVSILTWDKRVDLKALNKEGKRALDIALNDSGKNPSFGQRLTWEALRYVSGPRAPPRRISTENPQSSKVEKTLSTDRYKARTDTLLLVATLVATVTFAAAFTMPGGYKESGGMAKFLEKPMFHVFVISNSIAMYSAITAVVALIWAHLGDLKLFISAYKFSLPILGLAITMVSLAFMAGNYLVLRDLNWLAYLVLSIGSFFLFTLSIIFFPLFLPNSSHHRIIRYLLRYPFYLLIIFTRCDTDDEDEE